VLWHPLLAHLLHLLPWHGQACAARQDECFGGASQSDL
jgi:hypothetical protein